MSKGQAIVLALRLRHSDKRQRVTLLVTNSLYLRSASGPSGGMIDRLDLMERGESRSGKGIAYLQTETVTRRGRALLHLECVDTRIIADDLKTLKESGLAGDRVCFVGAPLSLTETTSRLADRLGPAAQRRGPAALNSRLFIVALKQFRLASPEAIMTAYDEMLVQAGDCLKVGKTLRVRRSELSPIGQ
jgi:hypothetical protein